MIFQSGEHNENALKIVEKSSNMPKKISKMDCSTSTLNLILEYIQIRFRVLSDTSLAYFAKQLCGGGGKRLLLLIRC